MGCWNETCGVSNLSINHGDKVVLIILQETWSEAEIKQYGIEEDSSGMCYPDDLWNPRYLPIHGKYNDYGSIEKVVEDLNTRVVVQDIKEYLVPKEVSYDKPVSKENANLKNILHWIERGNLRLGSIENNRVIGQMLVLEDIYNEVVNIGKFQNTGWRKLEDKELAPLLGPHKSNYGELTDSHVYFNTLRTLGFSVESNSSLGRLAMRISGKTEIKDSPEIAPLRKKSKEFFWFTVGLSKLRKFFSPQTGKGSQDDNEEAILTLNGKINIICKERIKAYED